MKGQQGTGVWTLLANGGPATSDELPNHPTPQQRQDGVCRFTMGSAVSSETLGNHLKPVYYIEGKHPPEAVLKKFYEVNGDRIVTDSKRALHWNTVQDWPEFKEASRELLGPFPSQADCADKSNVEPWDCPLCDETVQNTNRHRHLEGHA